MTSAAPLRARSGHQVGSHDQPTRYVAPGTGPGKLFCWNGGAERIRNARQGLPNFGTPCMKALKTLANDSSVVITQADKGGGVVIMDKSDYVSKMHDLLEDTETYKKKPSGYIEQTSKNFKGRVSSVY